MATGLYIAMDFKPRVGGIAEHGHQMAKHLTELGEQITVLTPALSGAAEFDKTCGYPVVRFDTRLPLGNWLKSRLDRRLILLGILRVARRIKADYLVCDRWSPIAGVNVVLASKFLRLPFFLFAHGTEVARPTHLGVLRKFAFRNAAKAFCVSRYTKALVNRLGVRQTNLAVIPNGFDVRELDSYQKRREYSENRRLDKAFEPGTQTILTISRLVPRKGIDKVIEAMPLIMAEIPEARYVIGGDGGDRDRLRQLANASPAKESITFLGRISEKEKHECYKRCDVFVMPNRESAEGDIEGFGIVFLEANAFGKPVVGGRSGGAVDAIKHGITGLLVNPTNVLEIAAAVIDLLTDKIEAEKLGQSGMRRIESEFNWTIGASRVVSSIEASLRVQRK